MTTPRRQAEAALLATGAIAVLATLVNPTTGWLARYHGQTAVALVSRDSSRREQTPDPVRTKAVVDAHPGSFPHAFGAALEQATTADAAQPAQTRTALDALDKLSHEYPERPEVLAALLRLGCRAIPMGRDSEQRVADGRPPRIARAIVEERLPSPADLAWFDEIAARGEALDPDNAFFPALRAVGHLAARKDKLAWDALSRASRRPRWKEYVGKEVEARNTIAIARGESPGSLARSARWAGVLFPHYAHLRALSRLALGEAVRRETTGNAGAGIALRNQVHHVAGLVRTEGTSLIANLVGSAMDAIAHARPGGQNWPKPAANQTEEQTIEDTRKRYAAYGKWAESHGEARAVASAREDWEASQAIKTIARKGIDKSPADWGTLRTSTWEIVGGVALLSNLAWVGLVGLAAAAVARWSPIARGEKLPPAWFAAGLFGLSLLSIAGSGVAVLGLRDSMAWALTMETGDISPSPRDMGLLIVAGLAFTAVVGVTNTVLLIRAALQPKGSFSRTLVLGWRAVAIPLFAILALGWAGFTSWSARRDQARSEDLGRLVLHEGRTLASRVGITWPGDSTGELTRPQ